MPALSTWAAPKPVTWGSWITVGGKAPPPWGIDPTTVTQRCDASGISPFPSGELFRDIKYWDKTDRIRFPLGNPAYGVIERYAPAATTSPALSAQDQADLELGRKVRGLVKP